MFKHIKLSNIKKISSRHITLLSVVAVLTVLLQVLVLANYFTVNRDRRIDDAKAYGESVAAGIKLSLSQSIYTSEVLKNIYYKYSDTINDDFQNIGEDLINNNNTIGSIYIAPDGIIQYAYPDSVKESTIGFNMLEDPAQGPRALLAIATKQVTVAGPHQLVEGGTGFIIRNPYFDGDKFQFFSIVILDWDNFVKQVLKEIGRNDNKYKFAVWMTNADHIVTDEYGNIFKDSDSNVSRFIDLEIGVPNDTWHLSIEPIEGWYSVKNILPHILISSVIVILFLFMLLVRFIDLDTRMYALSHDELTGYLTRPAFYRAVDQLLKNNPNKKYDIIVADIENFKMINSIYGEAIGDELLKYITQEFVKINKEAIYGRLGGNTFINIFPSSMNIGTSKFIEFSNKIIANAPIKNFKINYGFYGRVDRNLSANLLSERALLAAKSCKNNYEIVLANYDGPVSSQHLKKRLLESSFESAIKNKEFKVWYQPKFDAKTENLIGAEALVRWEKPTGEVISPGDFIPIYETDGLIVQLDEYVFRTVCEHIKEWKQNHSFVVPVSVNVSRTSLHHFRLIMKYSDIIEEYGLSMDDIHLELTESATISDLQIQTITTGLKNSGFILDMDDFGSGFSSLKGLNTLPFDVIKLDKSLIDFIGEPGGDEILRHTIEIAHFKKMFVIAEGVETKKQLDFLRSINCDGIQGFYFSRPLSVEDSIPFLQKMHEENRIFLKDATE